MQKEVWHTGFEPVIDENSKVLILGSFPSVKSREQGFYYGNKQNRFWKVLEETFGEAVPQDVIGRRSYLIEHQIALWDVIESSSIEGSLDSNLNAKNSVPVNFEKVLREYSNIKLIVLNGRKAFTVFKRFNKNCKTNYLYLPSTSPANVRFDINEWINILKKELS